MAIRSTSIRDTISVVLLETPTQRAELPRLVDDGGAATPLMPLRVTFISADGYTSIYTVWSVCFLASSFFCPTETMTNVPPWLADVYI